MCSILVRYCSGKRMSTDIRDSSYEGLSKYEGVSNVVLDVELKDTETTDCNGLRISPAKLIFLDTYVGQIYLKKITFQNVCNHKIVLRILRPYSLAFKVSQEGKWIFLPPGMKTCAKVYYRCAKNKSLKSSVPILINDVKYEIPLEVQQGEAKVKVYPKTLDFGVLDVGCPFVNKTIFLDNEGVCPTMFTVDFATSNLQLVAYPKIGRIGAYKSKTVKVVMTCFVAGEYMVEMWVKTEPLQSVLIKAIFMKPYLSALHPLTTGDFTLIDFSPTLEETVRRETLIIRNVSSRISSFTVLAEVGTTEIMTLERARESDVNFTYFSIDPLEGKMGPFEGRLFTASFHPTIIHNEKGWKHKGDTNTKEYLAFLRLIRVEVVDTEKEGPKTEKDGAQSTLTDDSLETPVKLFGEPTSNAGTSRHQADQIILRLCLHGLAMKPLLEIIPDLLTFDVDVGSVATKVLSFKNITPSIVLGYRVIKTPFLDVIPPMRLLQPMQRVEALVRLKAFSLGTQNTLLTIEMVAPKEVSDDNINKKIGSIDLRIKIKVRSKPKELKPRFNMGISPKEVVHEVGANIDRMTYKSTLEGEKAPILLPKPTKSNKRPWLNSRYTIAVPNDRGLSFATRPYDKKMLTPYTGKRRYIPPVDTTYAYTEEVAKAKKQNDNKYRMFMLKLGRERRAGLLEQEAFVNEYDYKLDRRLFDKTHMYDDVEDCTFDSVFKDMVRYSDLCPLSPLSLFNIKVHPKNLDFGLVPPGVDVTNYITVENMNKFPVAVKLITQKVGIIIPEPAFRVNPNSSVTKPVMIHLKNNGKFFSNLNYIINTHHMFDLKITAEAIRRTLELSQTVINFPKPAHEEIFQLQCVPINIVNPLSVPTSFYWKLPPLTAFKVLPLQGTIGGLHSLNCTLYYEMNTKHFASSSINLVVVKGPTIAVQCNAPEDAGKLSLFNSKVYCPSISLGLPFIEEVLLFNPNHRDAVFFVQNTNPVEGVNIRPACGIVKARACFVLILVFTMNRVTMFDFRVNIDVNAKTLLYFKVNGFVIYPKVKFSPPVINFKIIPCYSYETASVEMQNESDAPALVNFAMEDAYQMKISLTKHVREPGLLSDGISIPPKSGQKIYLHFLPRELSSYVFYLPAIVNNIVGPPNVRDEKSVLTKTYIKSGDKCQGNKCGLLDMPESLSIVKIDCTTINALITFSHFELNFVKKGNIRELQVLKVKNQLNCMMKLWFDYEQIFKSPFQIMKNNKSVKVLKLHPLEEIVLHTYFCPSKPGTYIADLPVYISSKKNVVFYNVIRFTGIYHKSSLYCSEQLIYFLPMPLNIEAERSIFIIANHQQKKTELMYSKFVISGEFDDHNIWCDFPKGTKIIPGIENFTIPVTVKFCSNKALSAIVALKFSDGCDGICKVGVCFTAENCRLTTYAFSFLSSLPADAADVIDLSETSVMSDEKDSPHSESDIESSRRDRVDSSTKRISKKINTRASLEDKSSSNESKQLRGSLMDHISDSLKRKASLQNRTRSNESSPEKVSKPSLGRSETLEPDDDNLAEEGSEELKGQYFRVLVEVEQYPLFPCDISDTLYAEYMRREEEFVEQWVYEQGFQCSFRMHIGEDIFNSKSFQKCLISRSKSYQSNIRSLLDLVLKLSGRELEMVYAASSPLPEDDRERIIYCLKIYNQIITFLKNQGALMEHVFPFYLLGYDDYLIYYQEIRKSNVLLYSPEEFEIKSDRVMFDKEKYERLGHQCWLDLFLQLFKVILLFPIHTMLVNAASLFDSRISANYNLDKTESKSEDLRGKYEIRSSILLTNVNTENVHYYSVNENILLNWMNHLFELKRNKWNAKDKSLCVPPRKITNFTTDLRDGVVLTAVTTYYCPYLIQEFQNFYYKPISEAEYLHNAQLLTVVWWNIRLGLVITPLHFQRTDQLTMTFIVTHLYYSLRSYVPRSSLKLTASLSSTMIRKLSISNPSDSKIRFILYKIGDINDCFEITKPHTITIASKQKISLVISYFAKRLFKVKCVLMFCGSCMAGNYANNLVFEVEAEPNKLELQSHYIINVPIYRTVFINIKLTSPYDSPAIFDIWYTEHEPVPGNVIIYKWSNIKDIKIPRMLYIGCSQINVPCLHTRPAMLPLIVACFSLGVNYFWLIFSNDSLGDFIIKLTVTPRYDYEHDVFKVELPSEECLGVPTALCSANCPRLLYINVPSRNARFWETLKTMLFFTLTDKEKKFWNTHLETTIGLKLIKWMIGEVKDSGCKTMADIFNPKITFNLGCDSDLVEMQSSLTVNDVHADTTIPIPVHIRSQVSSSFSTKLEMISEDEAEVRVYKIEFELQAPSDQPDKA